MAKTNIERFLNRKCVKKILGETFVLTDDQTKRLNKVFETHGRPKAIEDWCETIARFVENDLTNYSGRLRRLMSMPASPNKLAFVLRYGKSNALIRYANACKSKTKNFTNVQSYWEDQGLLPNEAASMVRSVQQRRGEMAAAKLRGNSEFSCRSLSYWIKNGLSYDEAKDEVKRVQARKHTSERNKKWQNTLKSKILAERELINLKKTHSVDGYMARGMSQSEAEEAIAKHWKKRKPVSKLSCRVFEKLFSEHFPQDKNIYFHSLNGERQFGNYSVDFYDSISGLVIEFHGDYWHCNPEKYNEDFVRYGKSAKEVLLYDKFRMAEIKKHPEVADVLVVWESEFRREPDFVIKSMRDIIMEARSNANQRSDG